MEIASYPSIFNLGHRAVQDLLKSPVIVQEKIDGSQISFVKDADGTMRFRSKGAIISTESPEGMFAAGVKAILEIADRLTPGWVYRGEYLQKPKHNALVYDRVPSRHIILFDICPGLEEYLPYHEVIEEGERIGLEVVPCLGVDLTGDNYEIEDIKNWLQTTSILGGQKIEGVVIKPLHYDLYGQDKKVLMGKYVSEEFKEVHRAAWKQDNPGQGDILARLALELTTPARWQKAVLHLREQGLLEDAPKDIGKLIPEVIRDVETEEGETIREQLWMWAWKDLKRKVIAGLPEWYKEELLKKQFEL